MRNFLDLHYHANPDVFIRRHGVLQASKKMKELGGAAVFKSHLGSTSAAVRLAQEEGFECFSSHTLNRIAGGIDYKAVLRSIAEGRVSKNNPLLVFFPTMKKHKHKSSMNQMLSHYCLSEVAFEEESLLDSSGKLRSEVSDVLKLARDFPVFFATGHSDKEEVFSLLEAVEKLNIDRLLITHPAHPCSGLKFEDLTFLSKIESIWFEHTSLTLALSHQTEHDFIDWIKKLPRLILSSDFGQKTKPDIGEWFTSTHSLLKRHDLSFEKVNEVLLENPKRFLNL